MSSVSVLYPHPRARKRRLLFFGRLHECCLHLLGKPFVFDDSDLKKNPAHWVAYTDIANLNLKLPTTTLLSDRFHLCILRMRYGFFCSWIFYILSKSISLYGHYCIIIKGCSLPNCSQGTAVSAGSLVFSPIIAALPPPAVTVFTTSCAHGACTATPSSARQLCVVVVEVGAFLRRPPLPHRNWFDVNCKLQRLCQQFKVQLKVMIINLFRFTADVCSMVICCSRCYIIYLRRTTVIYHKLSPYSAIHVANQAVLLKTHASSVRAPMHFEGGWAEDCCSATSAPVRLNFVLLLLTFELARFLYTVRILDSPSRRYFTLCAFIPLHQTHQCQLM